MERIMYSEKTDRFIELQLKEAQCTMFSPHQEYEKDENGFFDNKKPIAREDKKLEELEQIISLAMTKEHQQSIADTLRYEAPILHIDCDRRLTEDIVTYLFKQYLNQSTVADKQEIVQQMIKDFSSLLIEKKKEQLITRMENKQRKIHDVLAYYDRALRSSLPKTDYVMKNRMIDESAKMYRQGLGNLMEKEGKKHLYIYLDNISSLTIPEQKRINTLMYTRGLINYDRWIRLKINNGKGSWGTQESTTEHLIESPFDYLDLTISLTKFDQKI